MFSANPYEEVQKEISQGLIDRTLWVQSFAETEGDEKRTLATYTKHRARFFADLYEAEQLELRREAKAREHTRQAVEKQQREAQKEMARRVREDGSGVRSLVTLLLAMLLFLGLLATCTHH